MSSIISHSALQYLLPALASQLQGGCAHFFVVVAADIESSNTKNAAQNCLSVRFCGFEQTRIRLAG